MSWILCLLSQVHYTKANAHTFAQMCSVLMCSKSLKDFLGGPFFFYYFILYVLPDVQSAQVH